MAKSKFYEEIKNALIEREVEDVYNKGINLYFPNVAITHPFACDGLVETTTENHKILKLIIEYKLDEMMKSSVSRAKVLVQVVYYLKRFEENGLILPNVCMVGDVNECFVLHTNPLLSYLDENLDWTIAPSEAHKYNPDLVMKIANNEEINPFVFDINDKFSFKEVADKIANLADNIHRFVRVTEHNIATIFDYFTKNVVKDAKKIAPNDLVAIFMGVITDKNNYYVHPESPNVLVTPSKKININGKGFKSFFSYFDRVYTPQEKNKFAEISDRLVEDTKRRNTGEFYTPTLFVDYAHNMLAKTFGEDWKEKFVVWDNCCGTKNLTRDYHFKELYCSTLENAELEISSRYNKEAVSFQFDFLNDSLDKLPEGLRYSFEDNKPIIFLINPPYATAANMSTETDLQNKRGCATTMVQSQMKNFGKASANLYAQFLYRIAEIKKQYNLTNVHIGLFSPTLFLAGSGWKKFREYYFNHFNFVDGVQFKASHFSDVADNWGISFSIWNNGICENKNEFNYNLIDNIDGEINVVGSKIVYNLDNAISGRDWAKEPIKNEKLYNTIPLKSGINIGTTNGTKLAKDYLGCYVNGGNNVYQNTQLCFIISSGFNTVTVPTFTINKNNFNRVCANFATRRLIERDWLNWADEYLAPNTDNEKYKEFENDSIIYSLFESKSNQSSLREVEYKGKKWDIKNEFFFMGKDEIKKLANENNNDDCYNDCNSSNERYVYNLLKGIELSADAKAVLDKAKELVVKSFKYRSLFNEEHPEYQINNWDCGWYQIKALVKEYMPNEYKEFNDLYKKLADKMRPMVYELGFLK